MPSAIEGQVSLHGSTSRRMPVCLMTLLLSIQSLAASPAPVDSDDPVFRGRNISAWVKQLATPPEPEMLAAALMLKDAARERTPGPLPAAFRPALPLLKALIEAHGNDQLGREYDETLRAFGADAIPQYTEMLQGTTTYLQLLIGASGLASVLQANPPPEGDNEAALLRAVSKIIEVERKSESEAPAQLLYAFQTILFAGGAAAVPELARALDAPRPDQRAFFIGILGQMGPTAKDALPALMRANQDPDELVQNAAAAAISLINGVKPFCNDEITRLYGGGISTSQLMEIMEMEKFAATCQFDVSEEALRKLRENNLPEEVVQKMIRIGSTAQP